jgi:carboxylesterase type B
MEPTVNTRYGRVRGQWGDGVARFLGVPYAASPTGPLRFRAPAPPLAWDGSCLRPCSPTGPSGGQLGAAPPQALADWMHAAWVAFAGDGDPGWRAFDDKYPVMIFEADSSGVQQDPRGKERRSWEQGS